MKSDSIQSCSGSHSVRMRENTDQNKSKHGHFLRSAVNQHTSEAYSKPSKKSKMEFLLLFFILDDRVLTTAYHFFVFLLLVNQ